MNDYYRHSRVRFALVAFVRAMKPETGTVEFATDSDDRNAKVRYGHDIDKVM